MITKNTVATNEGGTRELIIERTYNAPREMVFNAWTDPVQFAKWWGPKDWTNPECELDARPGGKIHVMMTGPDGNGHPMGGTFHEISRYDRIVLATTAFKDEQGEYMIQNMITIKFEDLGGKTKLTVHTIVQKAHESIQFALAGMHMGWDQSLDKLESLFA
ncbi:MAG TPA: SRPBCC domain-containing protein [Bacteroidia bacterium]|nr:SRPBCC domain-containing protein [Bacteroidia bacterium]